MKHRRQPFTIELKGFAVQVAHAVWAYTDATGLSDPFARLASYEGPWNGDGRREPIEGEFSLSARCSPLGEGLFSIRICGLQGAPEKWQVSAALATELGQLPKVPVGAHRFFGDLTTHSSRRRLAARFNAVEFRRQAFTGNSMPFNGRVAKTALVNTAADRCRASRHRSAAPAAEPLPGPA
ncbi:DUF6228 family protein [Corticibacter populi]|uniref:DUF6228 family protein n=1 Tax=Corticibacter populi TaxID=1550736 RepID=UPI003BF80F30